MAIIRFNDMLNPFDRLLELQREMDRFFNRDLFPVPSTFTKGLFPAINIFEKENAYVLTLELPGFSIDDLNMQMMEKQLIVEGKRKPDFDEKKVTFHRRERQWGHFSRSITLPDKVNREKVIAKMKDGVLVVTVAKAEETLARQIKISAD